MAATTRRRKPQPQRRTRKDRAGRAPRRAGQRNPVTALRVRFPKKLVPLLFRRARYKVAYGGRGGAKSWAFARALLLLAARAKLRILCTREFQNSITDSVHKLLKDQIEPLGLLGFYDVQKTTIRGRNGSEFIFAGLRHNIDSIKSMEGIDIVWVEEAENVSAASWDVLIPTIRKDRSEIWISFNPKEKKSPTYQRFVLDPPPGATVVKVGWQDNPWFPEVLRLEKDHAYRVDADAARHVWGGEPLERTKAEVLFGKWVVDAFVPGENWDGPYYGVDWGFATDPTVLVRCWVQTLGKPGDAVRQRRLYIEHEAYRVGLEIDQTPAYFNEHVPGGSDHVSRADSARPETISHMQRHGYPRMEGVEKWAGSVEDGVAHLRGYEQIVIHPRCKHTIDEAGLWRFKVDRLTGDVLPELVDAHNHCWDAVRYALAPLIRQEQPFIFR
jgi:phage terminase large subunit